MNDNCRHSEAPFPHCSLQKSHLSSSGGVSIALAGRAEGGARRRRSCCCTQVIPPPPLPLNIVQNVKEQIEGVSEGMRRGQVAISAHVGRGGR